MAMNHREGNRAKWIGVRPAHDGTQVIADGTANNNTVVLHTVTAGKTLMLKGLIHTIQASVAAVIGTIIWTDSADVLQHTLSKLISGAAGALGVARDYSQPLEIPAGHKVKVVSSAGTLNSFGAIDGWEE